MIPTRRSACQHSAKVTPPKNDHQQKTSWSKNHKYAKFAQRNTHKTRNPGKENTSEREKYWHPNTHAMPNEMQHMESILTARTKVQVTRVPQVPATQDSPTENSSRLHQEAKEKHPTEAGNEKSALPQQECESHSARPVTHRYLTAQTQSNTRSSKIGPTTDPALANTKFATFLRHCSREAGTAVHHDAKTSRSRTDATPYQQGRSHQLIPHLEEPNKRPLVSLPLCAPSHLQRPVPSSALRAKSAPAQPAQLLCSSHSCAQCGVSPFAACERRARTLDRRLSGPPPFWQL